VQLRRLHRQIAFRRMHSYIVSALLVQNSTGVQAQAS
jgi:hypothetical protein